MKLKDIVKYIDDNEHIVFTFEGERYWVKAYTVHKELPCSGYDNYLDFADYKVICIKATAKDIIEITIE